MIRLLLTATILLINCQSCFSQELLGTWYMVSRSGLIEFSITQDSIKTRDLFTDFSPKDKPVFSPKNKPVEASSYLKKVKLNDRVLLIRKSHKDSIKFSAWTVINLIDKKYFQLAWNIPDTSTNDIETLIQLHTNDNRPLFGYYLFSEHFIDSLKQMKSIDSLSLVDFKQYLSVYFDKFKHTLNDAVKYNTAYLSEYTYNFQLISQSLYDMGFNPLQNTKTMEVIYKKYIGDPEIKKMMDDANRK